MKKEQFLAFSLPYGLKIAEINDDGLVYRISDICSSRYNDFVNQNYYKPILRQLSELTKQIDHNGEKFVPIEIIGKIIEPNGTFEDGSFGWNCATGGDDYQDYYLEISKDFKFEFWCGHKEEGGFITIEENIHFDFLLKLIEWHFDIAGLIEKGEAIDVNTLTKNPYK